MKKLCWKPPVHQYRCKLFSRTSNGPALNLDCFSLFWCGEGALWAERRVSMQRTQRIKPRQSRCGCVSKLSCNGTKVANSVSLHFASNGVCLWMQSRERSSHKWKQPSSTPAIPASGKPNFGLYRNVAGYSFALEMYFWSGSCIDFFEKTCYNMHRNCSLLADCQRSKIFFHQG